MIGVLVSFAVIFFGWLVSEKKVDLFFPEEEQMIKYIREFAGIKED